MQAAWTSPSYWEHRWRLGGLHATYILIATPGTTEYTIAFGGTLANVNVSPITANVSGGASATVTQVATGGVGTVINDVINPNTALDIESDLALEPITLTGNGVVVNGHFSGGIENVSGSNTQHRPTHAIAIELDHWRGQRQLALNIGSNGILPGTVTITDGSSSFSLTKELTGTLILSGANSYHGSTFVNQGASANSEIRRPLGPELVAVPRRLWMGAQGSFQTRTT